MLSFLFLSFVLATQDAPPPEADPNADSWMNADGELMFPASSVETRQSGFINDLDQPIDWTAPDRFFFLGMASYYDEHHYDRQFEFASVRFTDNCYHSGPTMYQGWCNLMVARENECLCPDGTAVIGWKSEHKSGMEDRRWKPECAGARNMFIAPYSFGGDETVWSETGFEAHVAQGAQCGEGTVVCGLKTQYDEDNYDRKYKFKCCKVYVKDPSLCAAVEIKIKTIVIDSDPDPKEVILDQLREVGCGSSTPLQFDVSSDRSTARSFEVTNEITESWEELWSRSHTAEVEVGYTPSEKGGWGIRGRYEGTWQTDTTNSNSQTTVTSTREETVLTFSKGYSYTAPPGTIVTLKAMSHDYKANLLWTGTAECFSSTGELLETSDLSGIITGAAVGETTITIESESCPADGWIVHGKSHCVDRDWMTSPDGKYLYANSKTEALDLCKLNDGCECVMDRGCHNSDRVTRLESDPGFLDNVLGSDYILCRSGCASRLQASEYSCTLSTEEVTCTCRESGGGPFAAKIDCSDSSTWSCAGYRTCTDPLDNHYILSQSRAAECPAGFHALDSRERCEAASDSLDLRFTTALVAMETRKAWVEIFDGDTTCTKDDPATMSGTLRLYGGCHDSCTTAETCKDYCDANYPASTHLDFWPHACTEDDQCWCNCYAHAGTCDTRDASMDSHAEGGDVGTFQKIDEDVDKRPSGCWEHTDGRVRFNGGEAGPDFNPAEGVMGVRLAIRLVCSTDATTKADVCPEPPCTNENFDASSMCTESYGCYNYDEALTESTTPAEFDTYQYWADGANPSNLEVKFYGSLDTATGNWHMIPETSLAKRVVCSNGEGTLTACTNDCSLHQLTWEGARAYCVSIGLNLPAVYNSAENAALLAAANPAGAGQHTAWVWLGLDTWTGEENGQTVTNFIWPGPPQPSVDFTSWATHNPKDDYDCVKFNKHSSGSVSWKSHLCDGSAAYTPKVVVCGDGAGLYSWDSSWPTVTRSQREAQGMCHAKGLPLAVVKNDADNTALMHYLDSVTAWTGNQNTPITDVWLGLRRDAARPDQFNWDDEFYQGDLLPTWTNGLDSATVKTADHQSCVLAKTDGRWRNAPCDFRVASSRVICENADGDFVQMDTSPRSRAEAFETCRASGLTLPVPSQAWIQSNLDQAVHNFVGLVDENDHVWLGLTRESNGHPWTWDLEPALVQIDDWVMSAKECQSFCRDSLLCNHYSWSSVQHECTLLKRVGSSTDSARTISGPGVCPPGSESALAPEY